MFFPRTADSQRQIGFRQPVGAKSAGQKLGILAIARQQQDAAGVFVDPVHQSGTFFLFKFQTVKQSVDMKMRVGAALHRQPRRLVDRDHVVVFENYQTADEIDFLRRQFGAFSAAASPSFNGGIRTSCPAASFSEASARLPSTLICLVRSSFCSRPSVRFG